MPKINLQPDKIVDAKDIHPAVDVLMQRAPKSITETWIEVAKVVLVKMRCRRAHRDERDLAKTIPQPIEFWIVKGFDRIDRPLTVGDKE